MDYAIFEDYSIGVGIGIRIITVNGVLLFASANLKQTEVFSDAIAAFTGQGNQLTASLQYGCYQAYRFGGRYIFYTPNGLVFFACPLIDSNRNFYAGCVAGPLTMSEYDEFMDIDVMRKHDFTETVATKLRELLESVPYIKPERVRALSEQLFVCTSLFNGTLVQKGNDDQALYAQVSDQIHQKKREKQLEFYPTAQENEMLAAISLGEVESAQAILNKILGHVMCQCGAEFGFVRARVVELMSLISRAAIKGGAACEIILGLNSKFLQTLESLSTPDDLIVWINDIVVRYTSNVFDFAKARHVDTISKAVNYIRARYMTKVTLEEVASHVYLSPSYLSKIFKEETGQSFTTYVTLYRIKESKKLLSNPSIHLVNISELVGFEDQSYFTRVFKKTEGITPGKFRKRIITE